MVKRRAWRGLQVRRPEVDEGGQWRKERPSSQAQGGSAEMVDFICILSAEYTLHEAVCAVRSLQRSTRRHEGQGAVPALTAMKIGVGWPVHASGTGVARCDWLDVGLGADGEEGGKCGGRDLAVAARVASNKDTNRQKEPGKAVYSTIGVYSTKLNQNQTQMLRYVDSVPAVELTINTGTDTTDDRQSCNKVRRYSTRWDNRSSTRRLRSGSAVDPGAALRFMANKISANGNEIAWAAAPFFYQRSPRQGGCQV
ncbi:hypothetical protein F503_07038 [Ophiostoma piceae UAMH 11346]|uniref:Uncharacterized protein n=1 Tax=Ophiostoma piceae (strain UAMH 11346) TaxID=1262450 RepID=S3C8V1_OPHP1|nr:hypothetical protein F503_07038 [Ophiostoma piceae UAMH 11346]